MFSAVHGCVTKRTGEKGAAAHTGCDQSRVALHYRLMMMN
jgi:hypothetical protein